MALSVKLSTLQSLLVSAGLTLAYTSVVWAQDDINCFDDSAKVCRQAETSLPLRALPRAFSNIYDAPDSYKVAFSNITAFYPLYVFERQDIDLSDPANPKGWYYVGADVSDPVGWMHAKDLIEWRQALVVSYTHPGSGEERRNPVLMYDELEALKTLVNDEDREDSVTAMYAGLPDTIPAGVVSSEPKRFVDIETKEGFYILPVIAHEEDTELYPDGDTRYLQIAAAIPRERSEEGAEDTFDNQEFVEEAVQVETTQGTQAQDLGVHIKFVMDITGSMGPYIKATKDAVYKVAQETVRKIDTRVEFGLVGFSDQKQNFTPEPVNEEAFLKALSGIRASGGGDYQEEVFAGMKEAIESSWADNSLRIIVLVGDASSHRSTHEKSLTKMDASQIRDLADAENISVMSVHLKNPKAAPDHPLAQAQFSTLARNAGSQLEAYIPVDAAKPEAVESAIIGMVTTLAEVVSEVRGTGADEAVTIVKEDVSTEEVEEEIVSTEASEAAAKSFAKDIAAKQLVQYLGSAAKAPKDITVWVVDRDLADPSVKSLEVRLLIKKGELNDLIGALENVLKAVKRAKLTKQQFFEALQGVVAASSKGEDVSGAADLADAGLLPSWIASLPYKSFILSLDNEMFESMSPDERASLEDDIDAKLQLYREVNESDRWVALNEDDASTDHVYPISLNNLP